MENLRQNCIDVESMVVNLELDRVGFMKKISPSGPIAAANSMETCGCFFFKKKLAKETDAVF
jgi:hypothetical protein